MQKVKSILFGFLTVCTLLVGCAKVYPELVDQFFKENVEYLVKKIELCGKKIEAWGDSLTDAPNGWPVIYGSWKMVDLLGYDKITDQGLLTKNMVHNWGFPGRTATELADLWLNNADFNAVQIPWWGRNQMRDTAAITRAYDIFEAKMKEVGNPDFLVIGLVNANGPSEELGTEMSKIRISYNAYLYKRFGRKFVDPISFFAKQQNAYERKHGFFPMYLTQDGLHLNQDGAYVLGAGMAECFTVCAGYNL